MNTQVLERHEHKAFDEPKFSARNNPNVSFRLVDRDATQTREDFPTIMIVEDEPLIRDLLSDVLRGAGFCTIKVGNAEEAVQVLSEDSQRIDLLMADVNLPGMDGHELVQIARDFRPKLKVLFVTGNGADALLESELKDSKTKLLTKPFRLDEVTKNVSAML